MYSLRRAMTMLLLTVSSMAFADNYQFLTVSQSSDEETSYAIGQIERITFDQTNMLLQLTDGSTRQIPLLSLSKMFFSENDISAISQAFSAKSKIKITDGILRVDVAPGERVLIYDMKGREVLMASESLTMNVDNLPKGVYIVKTGNAVKKFMNK